MQFGRLDCEVSSTTEEERGPGSVRQRAYTEVHLFHTRLILQETKKYLPNFITGQKSRFMSCFVEMCHAHVENLREKSTTFQGVEKLACVVLVSSIR